jgi:hypothetical protein
MKLELEWLAAHPSSGKTRAPASPVFTTLTRERVVWIALSTVLAVALATVSFRAWLGNPVINNT